MKHLSPLSIPDARTAALQWLERSLEVTGYQGSAHSYSPLFGWKGAYPETTGYLIETMWDQHTEAWNNHARRCTDWLLTQQLPSGAFPGLTAGHRHPSVFNTTQILFGLARTWREIPENEAPNDLWNLRRCCAHAAKTAVEWLLDVLEPDGAWRQAAYVPGFVPTYYTRAVWGVLQCHGLPGMPDVRAPMRRALAFYAERLKPDGTIHDAGFYPRKPAFTHTLAYTLEGFWECARLLENQDLLHRTENVLCRLMEEVDRHGRIAGSYSPDWQGDYTFACPVGQAQFSALFLRMGGPWRASGLPWMLDTLRFQKQSANRNVHGALPGSFPLWGPYLRFRYPNWGVKFLLDALGCVEPGNTI